MPRTSPACTGAATLSSTVYFMVRSEVSKALGSMAVMFSLGVTTTLSFSLDSRTGTSAMGSLLLSITCWEKFSAP